MRLYSMFIRCKTRPKWYRVTDRAYKLDTARYVFQNEAIRYAIDGWQVSFKPVKS